jgi:RNA ligase (TIGR02306 family)
MNRKLASIQKIIEVKDIPNADRIQVAKVNAWNSVIRKNEYKTGDLCVFCEIDCILPFAPWSEFLKDKKNPDKPIRLRSIKLRGQISQGLIIPLSSLGEGVYKEGDDVSEKLNITKYEPQIPACLSGEARGLYPNYCPKSDELRLQSFPDVLKELNGKEVYWSVKVDGTSSSFMNIDGDIHVCSRNLSLKETEGNTYWKIFKKYELEKVLKEAGSYSIMGEIAGPSIQKNRAGLKDHELYVFNVYDIKNGKFLDFNDFKAFCEKYHLPTVPIEKVEVFNYDSVDTLVEIAKNARYTNGNKGEGYVIRPVKECYSQALSGRLSVKVINNDYLLEDND